MDIRSATTSHPDKGDDAHRFRIGARMTSFGLGTKWACSCMLTNGLTARHGGKGSNKMREPPNRHIQLDSCLTLLTEARKTQSMLTISTHVQFSLRQGCRFLDYATYTSPCFNSVESE